MGRLLLAVVLCFASYALTAQNFEIAGLEESYKGAVGEVIQAPVKIRNTFDKPITLVIRRIETQIGSTQKNFFCPDNNCLDQRTDTYTVRLEPGETLERFAIGLDAGLTEGFSSVKYQVFNKANPSEITQLDINFVVEGKQEKGHIYSSSLITIHDLYPNPVVTSARIDYDIHQEHVKAKIIIHNILGSPLSAYDLLPSQNSVKIEAEQLNTGIYFYTLYVNNESVLTRKLMVKK
ncbi:MAG TPA: T9SS type A sorting domain-containing protein [Cyclobacteriaceae bacterium]|nr:T9SS type A sorting domain-containing protein [Cyclobacteriaceae bacterium]HMV11224.1 T9SS type A sorting domain-containing protein [Cyclobacteriaceae bacterium]HMV90676.1 T9SS type A sorting domain-containing protein [Cyclobacteriaceae bacterium]HMX02563.1 T9SS type A sorting domain-containing protein [Cyclobacteriaceae bacterium]HMX50938.1 T9SS type A sorting domain-containing protein [Cyclobacteriaceae bacterium]